jgi:thiol peroxidase
MLERAGEAFELDEQHTVIGRQLAVSEPAPEFSPDWLDGESGGVDQVRLADSAGSVRLLNVINSIDTPVCHVETLAWQQRVRTEHPAVRVYTISMDLPFALDRWRLAQGVDHQLLSSHRSEQFGHDHGVAIKQWRLLQRAVFVIDAQGLVAHVEYVADQMREPDYDKAVAALG